MATVRQLLDEKGHNVITVGAGDTVFDAVGKTAEENIGSRLRRRKSRWHYYGATLLARNVFLEGRASRGHYGDPSLVRQPDLTAEECMAVMTEKRVRYLPVIDGEKHIGIIFIGDLVKSIISNHQFTIDQLLHYLHS